jgi:hypothetical protein
VVCPIRRERLSVIQRRCRRREIDQETPGSRCEPGTNRTLT